MAISGLGGGWITQDLMAQESVVSSRSATQVVIVVTNVRVLGFSAETATWNEKKFEPGEKVVSTMADGKVASVLTNIRALGFESRTGTWSAVRFPVQ